MTIKIAVSNQKGGVGKTDLCVNLASCLARTGKKTLILDMDPQGSATDYLTSKKPEISTNELLLDDSVNVKDIVLNTGIENLFLAPGSSKLNAARVQLMSDIGMQFKLRKKLARLKSGEYDYIFMDTPPSLCQLTINALTACDKVLIPVQAHYFAMDGVVKLINAINSIKEGINPKIEIAGIVLTMFDKRNRLSFEVEKNVRAAFKGKLFKTAIPVNVKLTESPSHHKPIILYSNSCKGAKAYTELAKQFIKVIR